jgi:hypothetical protein
VSAEATADLTLWVHLVSTLLMTGVIWVVQLVHYPLFAAIDAAGFPSYEQSHRRRITLLVAPLMIAEAVTAALLAVQATGALTLTGAALVVVIWASTAFVQVPVHERLSKAFDEADIRRLVAGNWVRTLAWSVRSLIAIQLLREGLS